MAYPGSYPNSNTMKYLYTTLLLAFLAISGYAQSGKLVHKSHFNHHPKAIAVTTQELQQLFAIATGKSVQMNLGNTLPLSGTVTKRFQQGTQLETMLIELPAYDNLVFTLSKRNLSNNRFVFIGHLYERNRTDGYELQLNASGHYQLTKVQVATIAEDCTQ